MCFAIRLVRGRLLQLEVPVRLQLGLPEDCGAEGEREGWGEAAAAAAAGAETADAREWWWWRGTEPWMMDVYLVRELYLPVCGRP